MDKIVEKYPFKKILYLNWYEAAIGHLLLFKYYVDRFAQNVYFLISEQGIMLKATTADYLRRADEQITKFFTAKIEQLELSGSADFYNNIIDDIKEQTEKLKQSRDCPYINLVYSDKLRNSCLAMKRHGYIKPYESWECHERERKGFCFLIVRPEHRWKQIATNVYELARKRYPNHSKVTQDMTWPVEIGYQKFIWVFLKDSFKTFKKSLEIKDNKADHCLTIIVKNDIPELNDLQKQIQSLTFSYRPVRPHIPDPATGNRFLILSTLDIERITELVYHQFGLTSFAKQLRRKMTGFLVISPGQFSDQLEDLNHETKSLFTPGDKEDLTCINSRKLNSIVTKLGRRHSIVNYEGVNWVQLRIEKPIRYNYESILKVRLPCLPRYYYWYQTDRNYYLLRPYIAQKFAFAFAQAQRYEQVSLLYSAISVVDELHQRGIAIGSPLADCLLVDEGRVMVEPDEHGSKDQDGYKLRKFVEECIEGLKDEGLKQDFRNVLVQAAGNPMGLLEFMEDYLDSNM